ncbi:MAG: ribosomal-processing cysteine protease Prp [Eubacteriales bacterium]|jgi:uncharacterized protein YsxB (DUF464 family)|nr:ribosomal-processing cysteine protease Prp [Sarcina sp.]MBR2728754.1 ribosomal-processing cysteine protease Prp [Lachnospiraceae bacterium]MDO4417216.1 ribosomal-processing cysteine protease Prp [Eubacteriales bacterium]
MTVVDIFKDKEGRYLGFECAGHADDEAEEGEDIVCAGISVLTINTINSLEALAKARISYAAAEEGGELSCRFESPPDEKATLLVDSMLLGLRSIRDTYGGEYLVINCKEE